MQLIRVNDRDGAPTWFNPDLISTIAYSSIHTSTAIYLNVTHGIYMLPVEGSVDEVKALIDSLLQGEGDGKATDSIEAGSVS